jgi:hypothetical protein
VPLSTTRSRSRRLKSKRLLKRFHWWSLDEAALHWDGLQRNRSRGRDAVFGLEHGKQRKLLVADLHLEPLSESVDVSFTQHPLAKGGLHVAVRIRRVAPARPLDRLLKKSQLVARAGEVCRPEAVDVAVRDVPEGIAQAIIEPLSEILPGKA